MKAAIGILMTMAAGAAVAQPEVTNVRLSRGAADNGPIEVTYTLSEPAVVLVDILTNGVSMGSDVLSAMKGDAGHLVAAGNRKATWLARKSGLPTEREFDVTVTAKVQAWSRYSPPDYLVVDLTQPSNFTYYATAEAIPGGVQADVNKTDRMIFRKIPAAGATMVLGSGEGEATGEHEVRTCNKGDSAPEWAAPNGYTIIREHKPHAMGFTNDYYLAIYECTQGQWLKIFGKDKDPWGSTNCRFTNYVDSAKRPVTGRRYSSLRGSVLNEDGQVANLSNWPVDGHSVSSGSEIRRFRKFTGLEYDLPTEAQWEFAARAGVTTVSLSGNAFMIDAEVNRYAWSASNWQEDPIVAAAGENQAHAVGQLLPNAWGLYDMMGNSGECCLDAMDDTAMSDPLDGAFAIDYPGPVSMGFQSSGDWKSPRRVRRGSRFLEAAGKMRVTRRVSMADTLGSEDATLRAWLPAESPAWQLEK